MRKILLLVLACISLYAIQKKDIVPVMEQKINNATAIIVKKDLTLNEKANMIFPLFNDVFDYALMTKLSLGKSNWIKMSSEQRDEFTKKFIEQLKNSFVDKISIYTDEKLNIIGLKELNSKRTILLTQLVGTKESYDIAYKFYKTKTGDWLIYDVDILGISLIQIYRSQFNNILEHESYETLLGKIASK